MPSRSRGARQLTTAQKGLGGDHEANRDRMLKRHVNGRPCWWCGQPMYREPERNFDGHALEADHSKSRSLHGTRGNRADRLLHKRCNIQRGNGDHDDQRPALIATVKQTPDTNDLGPLAMAWPTTWRQETNAP